MWSKKQTFKQRLLSPCSHAQLHSRLLYLLPSSAGKMRHGEVTVNPWQFCSASPSSAPAWASPQAAVLSGKSAPGDALHRWLFLQEYPSALVRSSLQAARNVCSAMENLLLLSLTWMFPLLFFTRFVPSSSLCVALLARVWIKFFISAILLRSKKFYQVIVISFVL